ncbi:hypothetical protein B0O99DRAFT_662349 [Bisporella sp. PMI_857]|nr:hypothetical protein B0O99DRAFT_662349 [Bisporella sp. PMI_857]
MKVVIVGAGPSGLVLALILARHGIKVIILEAASTVDERPRAAMYAPSAVRVLREAGVLDDIRRDGFIPKDTSWRKANGERIATVYDCAPSYSEDALTVLPLGPLAKLLVADHVIGNENIDLRWNSKVVGTGQDAEKAWAELENGEKVEGDYLCGCDGANSSVRKSLFGSDFPGKTWHAQVVATNVYYPLEKFGYDDINFIIHPEDYHLAARITTDGMWRVSYGEDTNLTLEEVIANQPAKYKRILPGNPDPGEYKCLSIGPYRIHQRCADRFRVGRILLAADAAHLVNPFGGLGLTGGLVDVGGLGECFEGIVKGKAGDEILDKYDEVRREMWHGYINSYSSNNFLRVSATDPDTAVETDEFLKLAKKAETDVETKKELDVDTYKICHDFRQYWKD